MRDERVKAGLSPAEGAALRGLTVFERGAGVAVDLGAVRAVFEQPEIEIVATLGMGEAASEAWGCDLSEEYVRINADYTT